MYSFYRIKSFEQKGLRKYPSLQQQYLPCLMVLLSPNLHKRLETFTAKAPEPQHRHRKSCKTCAACPICFENPAGQTYVEILQTEAFRSHVCRVYLNPQEYRYKVKYIKHPAALPLSDSSNYPVANRRHISLRKAFSKLEKPAQEEFTRRLTEGLKKHYWQIVPENKAEQLRRPAGPGVKTGHWLPANFALKTQGTTKARLVLDPSGALNQTLAKAPNLEQRISKVMRRIQAQVYR